MALLPGLAWAGALDQEREAWVIQARQGQLEQAAAGLDALYRHSRDGKVLDDLIAVQIWRKDPAAALASCEPCEFKPISNASLEALARAARDERRYPLAISYYRILQGRAPDNRNAWLGLYLSASDQGNLTLACQAASDYETRFGRDPAILDARIYGARRQGDAMGEMLARQQWLEQDPDNPEQLLALYRVAVSLGAGPAAADLMRQHPSLFTPVDRLWLAHYEAVSLLRSVAQTEDPALTTRALQRALALQERILREAPQDHPLHLSNERDRIVTLAALGRFALAERDSAALLAREAQPDYVLMARADALAGLGRSREASLIYDELAPRMPADKELREKRFYAYTDQERYDAAAGLLTRWQEPLTRWDFTGNTRMDNDDYERLLQLQNLLGAWRGQADEAERQLLGWLESAPANPWLWMQLGDLRRWRGHPDEADGAYAEAARWLQPASQVQLEPGGLNARLDRGQWQQTPARIRALGEGNRDRKELGQRLKREQAPTLVSEFNHGSSEGGSVLASRDWRYDARLYGPRSDEGHRLFVRRQGGFGEFDNEPERAAYSGLGMELSLYPLQWTVEGGMGSELNHRGYVWNRLDWRLGDQWSLGGAVNFNSADTPLRALARGDYADQYQLALSWRQDESREAGAQIELMDLSDGNLRKSVSGFVRQDLWRRDRWWLDGTLRAASSRNEAVEVDYFNPLEDRNLELELGARYRLPFDANRVLVQGLFLSTNSYWQQGYGGSQGWQLSYRHDWELSPALSLGYGLGRSKATYDGDAEYGDFVFANLQWSFL